MITRVLLLAALCLHPAAAHAQDRWFAKDKAQHFGLTMGISVGGYAIAAVVTEQERWRPLSGIGAGMGAAAAKELWDRSHDGTPSWRDFAWGAVGTAAGVTVAWIIDKARRGPPKEDAAPSPQNLPEDSKPSEKRFSQAKA